MLKKLAVLFAVAALGVVAYSWVHNWPIRFRPKWEAAPGSLAASRPSGEIPDNIVLVPAGDMATSVSVTWRTSGGIADGVVQYRKSGGDSGDWSDAAELRAVRTALSSPELRKDSYVHCFSATLADLEPGTAYSYRVGSKERGIWSDSAAFTTAEASPGTLTFAYIADTQIDPEDSGELLAVVEKLHPETAFYMHSGDIVDYGDWRNLWDDFLGETHGIFSRKPLAPAPGNHDPGSKNYGSGIFNAYFNTPNRAPDVSGVPSRVENYSFRSGPAYCIVVNRFDIAAQAGWLEAELRAADDAGAVFKIVMFHHPVYNPDASRDNAPARETWVPLFDRYGVDLVLTGHDHSYARSRRLRAGAAVPAGEFGTTYIVSTGCEKFSEYKTLENSAVQFTDVATCQVITLSVDGEGGGELRYRAYSSDGEVVDAFGYGK